MATRVYVGRLPYRATERDIERFFRGYGRLSEIILKNGFGFVDFEELRDAEDASHDLNGKELMGVSLIVEVARGTPRGRDRYGWHPPPQSSRRSPDRRSSRRDRDSSSSRRHRLVVENLSSRVTTQALKDLFRKFGEIVSADANGRRKNEGYVDYSSKDDAETALDKLDGYELEGRKIKVSEEKRKRSRTRSRSRSKNRRRSRSRSAGHKSPPARGSKVNGGGDDDDRKSPNGVAQKDGTRSRSGSHDRYNSDVDKRSEGSKERDD